MTFNLSEVLSPFNLGDLKKGDKIFACDSLETLKSAVISDDQTKIFDFEEYSKNIDCPFKSGTYGVNTYRYAYKVKNEEMIFKPNSWMKIL